MKLNFGCCEDILKGWVNYDLIPIDKRVKYLDLTKFPYPFKSNIVDKILISNTIEHFYKEMQIKIINECYRVLKKDGELIIRLPTFLPYISHRSCFHHDNYLNIFVKSNKTGAYIWTKKFKSIYVKGNRTKSYFWRIKKMIFSYLFDEYEYILKK